jgi:hypothetical protein
VAGERQDIRIVSVDFFKATGMTLVDGRTFDDGDRAGRPLVVLINNTMARQRFGNDNPIGRTVRGVLEGAGPGRVIGVVDDVKPAGVDVRIRPEVYVDFRQARRRWAACRWCSRSGRRPIPPRWWRARERG